jgi:rhodanese-related sulfurtransferase
MLVLNKCKPIKEGENNMKFRKSVLSISMALSMAAGGTALADLGNRYGLPQIYQSEISAAEAYVVTSHDKGNKTGNEYANAVIIDVRATEEHAAGHPPKSYSIPFPHVKSRPSEANDSNGYIGYDLSYDDDICFVDGCDDDTNKDGTLNPDDYVAYVKSVFPDLDTPILTMCATGYRSVQAANLLTRAGYTNVRNIWEGYTGQPKYAYQGGNIVLPPVQLDLDHNNATVDKDGWAGFQGLPTSTKIHPQRIDSRFSDLY